MNAFDYFFEFTKGLNKDFVLNKNDSVSFQQLHDNSVKLASWLNNEIGQDKPVLLLTPNSVFSITVYLAVIKSGNHIVPLNPEIEQENLDFIVNQTAATHVFITNRVLKRLQLSNLRCITETDYLSLSVGKNHDVNQVEEAFEEHRMAEIIFTSGSTGKPKGVMLSHKNLIANTSSIVEYLQLSGNDIMMVVLPFYYCYGLSLLHTHLRCGGCLVFHNSFMFIGSFINSLKQYQCTGFAGVPSHFQLLLRKTQSFRETVFPSLRYVTQAGGKLHNTFIQEFTGAFPEVKFYVMYGQTEATARLSYLPPEFLSEKLGSVGKGIPGVELKVVDKDGLEREPGKEGEIVAKGDNVMPGYYKDIKATNEIIKNGWLHTGDLGYRDEEGYIYLISRKKEIMKIGGKRVGQKEIEEVLVQLPKVVDAAVTAVHDDVLGEAIKAEIVVEDVKHNDLTDVDVRKFCSDKLAGYKIPHMIVFTDKLDVTATGKKIKRE